MIEFKKAYVIGSAVYATLEEAQEAEIANLIGDEAAKRVMENHEAIVDVLTTTPSSKPRARKLNGGKKTRKSAALNAELQDMKQ